MTYRKSIFAVLFCLAAGLAGAAFIRSANSGTPALTPDVAVTSPARDIALFASPQPAGDSHAQAAVAAVAARLSGTGQSVPEAWKPGGQVAGTARSALTSGELSIWAYRSTRGRVCEGLTVNGATQSASCTAGWSNRLPVDVNTDSVASGAQAVWGLAPDDVKTVSVVVDGKQVPAQMGRNAYLYVGTGTVTSVIAIRDDGTAVPFTIGSSGNPTN
jgi:hypothetical protein